MATEPRYGLPYPEPGATADVPYWMQQLAEATAGKIKTQADDALDTLHKTTSGTGALVGSYTGQRLRMVGGYATVATNASGDGGITLPAGITGLLTAGVNSSGATPWPVIAHIYKSAATTKTTISVRCYNGAAAAASTSVALLWWALVW